MDYLFKCLFIYIVKKEKHTHGIPKDWTTLQESREIIPAQKIYV